MGVNSLPKTVTRQRRGCDLNPGPSVPESSTLTIRLPSHSRDEGEKKGITIHPTRGTLNSTFSTVIALMTSSDATRTLTNETQLAQEQ